LDETKQNDQENVNHSEAVVRLFSQHQRWLYGYLTALVGNPSDAEDVMQEVCVVMWQEHEKFKIGTNFVSWLSVIAYHQVQKFWRSKKSNRQFLNVEVLGQLAEGLPANVDLLEARRHALAECITRLNKPDRQLVNSCYGSRRVTTKSVADELGRPAGTVYKALNRIRSLLFECIDRKVSAEGTAQ
jgi:RNA polymerase sigma-70 factor (ECF subfamily)